MTQPIDPHAALAARVAVLEQANAALAQRVADLETVNDAAVRDIRAQRAAADPAVQAAQEAKEAQQQERSDAVKRAHASTNAIRFSSKRVRDGLKWGGMTPHTADEMRRALLVHEQTTETLRVLVVAGLWPEGEAKLTEAVEWHDIGRAALAEFDQRLAERVGGR
jgi:hypothetical protein